jgi:hypothetical protein
LDIIAPTDIESKAYALKYILVHADNCDWDEKQNEVRGLKSNDCHGTLVGISVFTKDFNFLQIQAMWLRQSFGIPHNIMKDLNKQFKRGEDGNNFMKKSDDALSPISENLADTAREYCGMSIRNEFAPSPNEKKMTSRTLRRGRDVQDIIEAYHLVKYVSIYIDGALTNNEKECLPTLLKIHRGLAKYTAGNVCIPISCDQQMTHFFTIAIAMYAYVHPQLNTILYFPALWHGCCLHHSNVLNDFLKDMMLAITLVVVHCRKHMMERTYGIQETMISCVGPAIRGQA